MDYNAFLHALEQFVYIPPDILAYVRYAAYRQNDDGRRALLKKLQQFHEEIAPLEEERRKAVQDALAGLSAFEHTHLDAIRSAVETGERKSSLEKIHKAMN